LYSGTIDVEQASLAICVILRLK